MSLANPADASQIMRRRGGAAQRLRAMSGAARLVRAHALRRFPEPHAMRRWRYAISLQSAGGDGFGIVLGRSLRRRDGTRGAALDEMSTKTKRPSEAWTIPLHVIMWTTLTVGFIMTFVVLLMRR
jgi:hypothetical protein